MAWSEREEPPRVGSSVGRTIGFLVAALMGAVPLWLLNVEPGWRAIPPVTGAGVAVVPYVNASLALGCALNVAYAVWYRWWLRCLGEILGALVALLVVLRVWDVFPFDVGDLWSTVLRGVLAVAGAGAATGVVVHVVRLVRGPRRPGRAQTSVSCSGVVASGGSGVSRSRVDEPS
jgi:hypothetical protein